MVFIKKFIKNLFKYLLIFTVLVIEQTVHWNSFWRDDFPRTWAI